MHTGSHILLFISSATAAALSRAVNDSIVISIPYSVSNNASGPIDPAFAGFAFEERSFYPFFGTPENPKNLSVNLINAITEKTKSNPIIRVGGSSLDAGQYNPNQNKPFTVPKGEGGAGIPVNMTLGPSFFDAFATLPTAKYIIDIPMKKGNLSNSKIFATDAYKKVGAANIAALELGNEPNNYGENIADYIKEWETWTSNISSALDLNQTEKVYQAVALSSETSKTKFPGGTADDWKIPELFEQGLKVDQGRIKTVSMHYYQTKANPESNLQYDLMNHTAVTKGSEFVVNAVNYLNNLSTPIPLVLGEVGSLLGNSSNNHPLAAVLGSALWQVDLSLYSMSIGVKAINMQSGLTFPFSLWNPSYTVGNKSTPATVYPAFYGQIFSAEFISSGGNVKVLNIDLQNPRLSAYAAYDNGRLGRVAVTNFDLWSGDDPASRPGKQVTLDIGTEAKSVVIKKLTSIKGGTAGAHNITWGGMQWTVENDGVGKQVLNDTLTLPVTGGKVQTEVMASESVMIFVQS